MIRPLGDRVLVDPIPMEEMIGGVVIPDSAREKPQSGKVLAVGEGMLDANGKRNSPNVVVGEIVLFSRYGGVDVKNGEDTFLILREGDLLGVVEED